MDINSYQRDARTTAIYPGKGELTGLLYVALGLGEVGELQGKVKKILRDDAGKLSNEKREELIAELGDVLWYVSQMASELDIALSAVAFRNLSKLRDRAERGKLQGSGDHR